MSLIFGAVGAGQAGAFAPNYMPKPSFNYSANRIFFLLDRVPLIDGYVPLIDGYSAHAGMRMYILYTSADSPRLYRSMYYFTIIVDVYKVEYVTHYYCIVRPDNTVPV